MTTTTIPTTPDTTTAPPPGTPPPALFSASIPEAYRDRPYLKDIAAMPDGPEAREALYKKLDGAETLIGKKGGIPAADAKPEEWDAFHAKLRPETAEAYDFPVGKDADPVFLKAIKDTFHVSGLSKGQGLKVVEGLKKAIETQNAGAAAAQKAHNDEFDTMAAKYLGAESDKVLASSKALLAEVAPKEMLPFVEDLDNKALILLAGSINALKKQYGVEDTVDGDGGAPNAADEAALKAEGLKLLASPEYKDFTNPASEATRARVKTIYAQLGKMKK